MREKEDAGGAASTHTSLTVSRASWCCLSNTWQRYIFHLTSSSLGSCMHKPQYVCLYYTQKLSRQKNFHEIDETLKVFFKLLAHNCVGSAHAFVKLFHEKLLLRNLRNLFVANVFSYMVPSLSPSLLHAELVLKL